MAPRSCLIENENNARITPASVRVGTAHGTRDRVCSVAAVTVLVDNVLNLHRLRISTPITTPSNLIPLGQGKLPSYLLPIICPSSVPKRPRQRVDP